MIEPYITIENLKTYAYQFNDKDVDFLIDTIPRASRIFDKLCRVRAGYFSEKSTNPEAKVVYGSGATLLALPPYFGDVPSITMPENFTVPPYIIQENYVMTTDSTGRILSGTPSYIEPVTNIWPLNVPITVTAKWGYETVPEDVVEAVCELAIAIWRSKDTAFLKAINLGESISVLAQAIPDRVKMIANGYRSSGLMPAFV